MPTLFPVWVMPATVFSAQNNYFPERCLKVAMLRFFLQKPQLKNS